MKVKGTRVYRGEAEVMLEQTIRLGGERGTLNLVLSFDQFPASHYLLHKSCCSGSAWQFLELSGFFLDYSQDCLVFRCQSH